MSAVLSGWARACTSRKKHQRSLHGRWAQAESESLSGNVKWGHRKRFKDGKVYYNYANFLGCRKGADGLPEIDPDEATIVRRIFSRYLPGDSVVQIAKGLKADGIKTARGKDDWGDQVIRGMLQSEKYIGDALLQKTYIADLFTRQAKKNLGGQSGGTSTGWSVAGASASSPRPWMNTPSTSPWSTR